MSEMGATDVLRNFAHVIDVLRYHVATGRFSYVDRIMAAMDPSVVEETVREAVRTAISAASSPKTVRGKELEYDAESRKWKEGGEIDLPCVEDEVLKRLPPPTRAYLHGKLIKVGEENKIVYTPPRIPSEDELARFFDATRTDLRIAKLVASLAMTIRAKE